MEASTQQHAPGWYEFHGGQRYWDGTAWTDHLAPPPPKGDSVSFGQIAGGTAVGVLIAWLVIYLGAQLAPEEIYWPVKFVVEDLPSFGR